MAAVPAAGLGRLLLRAAATRGGAGRLTLPGLRRARPLPLCLLLLLLPLAGGQMPADPNPPLPAALAALAGDASTLHGYAVWNESAPVTGWGFGPAALADRTNATAVIFWSGGLVDSRAYAPLAAAAAGDGFNATVYLLDFPTGFPDSALAAVEAVLRRPEHSAFVFAGHSMGGIMAAQAALQASARGWLPAGAALGVAFLASYPDPRDTAGIAAAAGNGTLAVAFVNASNDGVLNTTNLRAAVEACEDALPTGGGGTLLSTVEGGNHRGFGSYEVVWELRPDGNATISRHEQQAQALDYLALAGLLPGPPAATG